MSSAQIVFHVRQSEHIGGKVQTVSAEDQADTHTLHIHTHTTRIHKHTTYTHHTYTTHTYTLTTHFSLYLYHTHTHTHKREVTLLVCSFNSIP